MGLASVALFAAPSSKKAGAKLGEGTYKLIPFPLLSGVKALPGVYSSSPTEKRPRCITLAGHLEKLCWTYSSPSCCCLKHS